MTTEKIEKITEEVKASFAEYEEKKNLTARTKVRKALQALKIAAQEMRLWVIEDYNENSKKTE
jgi:hypothetical protein